VSLDSSRGRKKEKRKRENLPGERMSVHEVLVNLKAPTKCPDLVLEELAQRFQKLNRCQFYSPDAQERKKKSLCGSLFALRGMEMVKNDRRVGVVTGGTSGG
jgi:hypothetical protein